ncbi:MAG: response regulator transcription factor [Chloroflexi bacterium]|nr:response regulator transcription factor [Chloroflexota bacterium]MCH8910510.1 response regulator transcription factor [Chloroflexota bacterium]
MSQDKILVVEDSPEIMDGLTEYFQEEGFDVNGVASGDDALKIFYQYQPDLVFLDVMLPGLSGFEICGRIRELSEVPVIMYSALGSEAEKVQAFDKGADDYIVKGTGMGEVMARIAAVMRRSNAVPGDVSETYVDDVLNINFTSQTITVRGEPTDLTPTEYKLLTTLVSQKGRPIPAEQLLHGVWGREYNTDELVKWHVGHLRRKIELDPSSPKLIVTRRGYGYVYLEADESEVA